MSPQRADAACCLYGLGSVTTPACIIAKQKESILMGTKTRWLTDTSPEGACAGRSLVEIMEDELDEVYDRLVESGADADDIDKGKAQGIALCIAIIQAPYFPNVDTVRADAVRRHEWRKETRSSWSSAGSRASEVEDIESGD